MTHPPSASSNTPTPDVADKDALADLTSGLSDCAHLRLKPQASLHDAVSLGATMLNSKSSRNPSTLNVVVDISH